MCASVLVCACVHGVHALPGTISRAGELLVAPEGAYDVLAAGASEQENPYTCPDGVETAKEEWKVGPVWRERCHVA